jgi:hypothetical protein
VRIVCRHVTVFLVSNHRLATSRHCDLSKDEAQVSEGATPEWVVGEDGIKAEHLVLVSIKRVSIGCWVPCLRLINSK